MKKGMCQNTQNMKITPVTDICSKGNFVKKRVLTPSFFFYFCILLKDDTELKNYLLTLAITTINKHLKSENKKRVSKLSF